jgi:hypothetical protein
MVLGFCADAAAIILNNDHDILRILSCFYADATTMFCEF